MSTSSQLNGAGGTVVDRSSGRVGWTPNASTALTRAAAKLRAGDVVEVNLEIDT
jgi:hypothetical protein